MRKKIRILVLSSNTWANSRISVDEEANEIFERLQEGPYRDRFQLHHQAAAGASDLQKLLLMYEPHIVHFSGCGSRKYRAVFGRTQRPRAVQQGLANVFALYNAHVRLVMLNACFTKAHVQSISEVINYSIGIGKGTSDKVSVTFAGAFYRALGFGKSIPAAFRSAKAEVALAGIPRVRGFDLFVRNGVSERDRFPRTARLGRRRNRVRRLNQRRLGTTG